MHPKDGILDACRGRCAALSYRAHKAAQHNATASLPQFHSGSHTRAALLAGVGTGIYPDVAAACNQTLREGQRMFPNAARQAIYDRYYQVYRALYPALRASFGALTRLSASP